ncbi:dihydrolipoyl dehydrogenase 1, mitochondrial [Geobacter sp. OR-1]|uniref:dihydrolipoyl dehydrogenase n=1 Tax=Geobacter sp. OR-1 TaxID=1266765 RepID=UPI000542780A|nr:dihydrolipoyl dehydrogenase [Geobacter sp. OR-1]GAM09020.1 dihydrolipoyl dehydrogenase 1, mitochondrial [Geobacter sp. OR-1]
MNSDITYDLIVIGAGPGGYVAAIRASQLGMTVCVVEKSETLGGVCLNEGCIPSKALLDSSEHFAFARDRFAAHGIVIDPPRLDLARMQARKDDVVRKLTDGVAFLFKKNNVERLQGTASIGDVDGELRTVHLSGPAGAATVKGRRLLLATGSRAAEIPGIPFDNEFVVDARGALIFDKVPEHLVVIGAGYIGLELGSVWRRLGSQVTVVETLAKPLPATDGQVADTLVRSLKKQGMKFHLETRVTVVEKRDGKLFLTLEGPAGSMAVECDRVLVAAGRVPNSDIPGAGEAGVKVDTHGRIVVDEEYQTSVPGIYAIGDLISGPMLAHKASEEGVVCVERMHGEKSVVDYDYLPGIVYTWPEAAGVGKTEEQLKGEGSPYTAGRFSFMANGRAKCMDETDGFVKVLAHQQTGRVLGVHIIGPRASDMIAEAVTAMTYGATAEDIAMTFHAHPTLSEALKEAALDACKRAIHS